VKLIWGINPTKKMQNNLGLVRSKADEAKIESRTGVELIEGLLPEFDLTSPWTQQWLLEVVRAVKSSEDLKVKQNELTWIEMLHNHATKTTGNSWPIESSLFTSYVEILESQDPDFASVVRGEIGTRLLEGGKPLYESVTFTAFESPSRTTFSKWTAFADSMNLRSPNTFPI